MTDLATEARERKVLTIPRSVERSKAAPTFIPRAEASFMVWREGGDMPKKLYKEPRLPCQHAASLAKRNPGERFHVLRSWRICEAKDG